MQAINAPVSVAISSVISCRLVLSLKSFYSVSEVSEQISVSAHRPHGSQIPLTNHNGGVSYGHTLTKNNYGNTGAIRITQDTVVIVSQPAGDNVQEGTFAMDVDDKGSIEGSASERSRSGLRV